MLYLSIAALLLLCFFVWARFFSPKAQESRRRAMEAASGLRELLLSRSIFSQSTGAEPLPQDCIAADVSLGGKRIFTVAAFSDGTVSMYRSTGGGALGLGTKADVADVAREFRSAALSLRNEFEPIAAWPLPERGSVVYYFVTPSETLALPARKFHMSENPDPRHNELARWTLGLINFLSGIRVVPPRSK